MYIKSPFYYTSMRFFRSGKQASYFILCINIVSALGRCRFNTLNDWNYFNEIKSNNLIKIFLRKDEIDLEDKNPWTRLKMFYLDNPLSRGGYLENAS